jgi:Tol biopolymer transport system component
VVLFGEAGNLPGGGGGDQQVYLRDLEGGKTVLASRNNAGDPQDGSAYYGHVSGNGRYVVFQSYGDNLPGGGGPDQIYARDMRERRTRLLSRAGDGAPAEDSARNPSISLDGQWASFTSGADNLGGNTSYNNAFRSGPIG